MGIQEAGVGALETLNFKTCGLQIKAWNRAPNDLKNKANIYGAKAAIKKFVKTLPI